MHNITYELQPNVSVSFITELKCNGFLNIYIQLNYNLTIHKKKNVQKIL